MSVYYLFAWAIFVGPYLNMAWWTFGLSTVLIIILYRMADPEKFAHYLGLTHIRKLDIFISSFIFALTALASEFIIGHICDKSSIARNNPRVLDTWILQPIFQAFNEEVLARSAFLVFLSSYCQSRQVRSVGMALVFTIGHHLYCHFAMGTPLHFITNATIFIGTLALNNLYYLSRHIAYTWALHAGLNFSLFGGNFSSNSEPFNDAQRFNLILGDSTAVSIAILGLVLSTLMLYRRSKCQNYV